MPAAARPDWAERVFDASGEASFRGASPAALPAELDRAELDWAADLPEEFAGPVAYSDRWLWLALAGLLLVLLYYVAVVWLTRARPAVAPVAPVDVPDARRAHLARIDEVEADVRSGRVPARDGHQRLSEVVRSYVEAVGPLPATTMTLADFRLAAPPTLTDAIELMYPPEFAPGEEGEAEARFDEAVRRSRQLVTTWT